MQTEQTIQWACAQTLRGFGKTRRLRFKREAYRTHLKGKCQDGGCQRCTRPAEHEANAELVEQECAQRRARTERYEQQIAKSHRRQHERQMHEAVDQRLAWKTATRQQKCGEESERQPR